MQKLTARNLRDLYYQDPLAWYEFTLEQIKNRGLTDLDSESLSEVLENLVRDTKRSGESYLRQLIIHLLMLEYWTQEREYNYRHWLGEIMNFRQELEVDMTLNLQKHLQQQLEKIYLKAVKAVKVKTGLNTSIFPLNCSYTLDQLPDEDWFPITIEEKTEWEDAVKIR